MKKSQLKIGSLLSYVQMALNIIINLVYTPVMIRLLGKNEYGLYQTVASTISMLTILNLGFNSGYIRYYAKYKREENKDAIQKLNGLFLIVFSIIGAVALVCGMFLTTHLKLVFDEGLTQSEYATARVLMMLLSFNLMMTFVMSVFSNIISAHEEFIFLKCVSMIKTVCSPLITLPLLLAGFRSVAMVAVTVSVSLFADILYLIYVLGKMKEKFVFHDFEKGIFKNLFVYTAFIAMNTIIDQINWNIDKMLLGRFKGTAEVAVYSTGFTLYHCYQLFSSSISSVFTPRIHKIINQTNTQSREQKMRLTELFIKVGRIQFLIIMLIATGIIFFGKYFILEIWVGKGYERSYIVALLLIIPASVALIQNLGIEIQRAENKHQFRSIVYLAMAFINLTLSIFLCQRYGAVGSVIGTAISLIVANGFIMNYYYQKRCNINIIAFWKSIIRLSVGLILPILSGVALVNLINIDSFLKFAVSVVTYTAMYCGSMWLLGMNKYEKELVITPIKSILKKVRKNA